MRKVRVSHNYQNSSANTSYVGYFHLIENGGVTVEKEDGTFCIESSTNIKFLDTPEDEQRAEFAKSAMQGILASNECGVGHNPSTASSWAVSIADALISELKKQKP